FASQVTPGGELMNTTDVENFPGFPEGVLGPDLMAKMQEQAEKFGAEVRYEDVVSVQLEGDTKTVTTDDDETFEAKAVILALGSEYRKLGLSSEEQYSGRGVSYCATCDGFFFRDQHIAVVGGGDSAMEEATFLSRFGSKVTVIHRRDELRASRIMAERAMADPKIEFAWNSEVAEVLGEEGGKMTGLLLRDTVTGETRELDATGLFVAIGHIPRTDMLAGQVALDSDGYVLVDHPSTRTNVPGVFACGDVVDHTYRQAITAAGTGCASALDAEKFLAELGDSSAQPVGADEEGADPVVPDPAEASSTQDVADATPDAMALPGEGEAPEDAGDGAGEGGPAVEGTPGELAGFEAIQTLDAVKALESPEAPKA
ncbi:MAG TPA: thioredoxin-disulfide reductase, partial [Actinomycetales bacterium]|nr:thioredoxin-disulfide reductase [Actinomycetales bacterium]